MSPPETVFKAGDQFGRWQLVSLLGVGGNGEVWKAQHVGSKSVCALKVLRTRNPDADGYKRFEREIRTLQGLAGSSFAVLPVLDSSLPKRGSGQRAWFAMPVATGIEHALRESPVRDQVEAIRDIALTLADLLVSKGINHRDLKPANLYYLDGRFVVGDFGLVKGPDDEQITGTGQTPGPWDYLPSELLVGPAEPDWERVDVYCLAKTLWVIVKGQGPPPRGPIVAGRFYSLSSQGVGHRYVNELDDIVDRATDDDPNRRPTMQRFATSLTHWIDALDIRTDLIATEERAQANKRSLLRWLVGRAQSQHDLGLELINIDDLASPSPIPSLSNQEFNEAMQDLVDLGFVRSKPLLADRREPYGWENPYPTFWGIEEVEDIHVMRSRAAPIVEQLIRESMGGFTLSNTATETQFGSLVMRTQELYFMLTYLAERGWITYKLERSGAGAFYVGPRVTAQGRQAVLQVEPPRHEQSSSPTFDF